MQDQEDEQKPMNGMQVNTGGATIDEVVRPADASQDAAQLKPYLFVTDALYRNDPALQGWPGKVVVSDKTAEGERIYVHERYVNVTEAELLHLQAERRKWEDRCIHALEAAALWERRFFAFDRTLSSMTLWQRIKAVFAGY